MQTKGLMINRNSFSQSFLFLQRRCETIHWKIWQISIIEDVERSYGRVQSLIEDSILKKKWKTKVGFLMKNEYEMKFNKENQSIERNLYSPQEIFWSNRRRRGKWILIL